jgi:hypothetical protein
MFRWTHEQIAGAIKGSFASNTVPRVIWWDDLVAIESGPYQVDELLRGLHLSLSIQRSEGMPHDPSVIESHGVVYDGTEEVGGYARRKQGQYDRALVVLRGVEAVRRQP